MTTLERLRPAKSGDTQINKILLRTNLLVCAMILIGFLTTSLLSYKANYSASVQNLEQVSLLSSQGIFYQMMSTFTKPVNLSLTMANDNLLKVYLTEEPEHLQDSAYVDTIQAYLNTYRQKYHYDSVFLVSTATERYYNFDGINRVMTRDNPENVWYYTLLDDDTSDYAINVDNDEAGGNAITVFVNCKIRNAAGHILGIVGVGLRVNSLQNLLQSYEKKYGVKAFLLNEQGNIEISTEHTGYQAVNLFDAYGYGPDAKSQILDWREAETPSSFWTDNRKDRDFMVTRYIPELSWHLVVERDTGLLLRTLRHQMYGSIAIILGIVFLVLLVISWVIRGFHRRITNLLEEHHNVFRRATEHLYDNIYEYNITKNCPVGNDTAQYFEQLGLSPHASYDDMLQFIVSHQVTEGYRVAYLNTFARQNILHAFQKGSSQLNFEFLKHEEGKPDTWMRIDAYIYYKSKEESVHMLTYRKNIDLQKRLELRMAGLAETDEMTGLYTKTATQRHIEQTLKLHPQGICCFFIFDIDNFKQVNDRFGHAFGDQVIIAFVKILKEHFRGEDIIGRIGGDEFAAFLPVPNATWAERKAAELSQALRQPYEADKICWEMSTSIGVSLYPQNGTDFDTLYRNADSALYQTKERGKNGYTIFHA